MNTDKAEYSNIGFRTPLESATLARFGWLIGMRWFFVVGIALGGIVGKLIIGPSLPLPPLLVTAVVVGAYNILLQMVYVRLPVLPDNRRRSIIHMLIQAQVVADWITLLILIHFTGGVESPLLHFYIFHVALSAIFLSSRFTVFALAFIILATSILFFAESQNLLPRVVLAGVSSAAKQQSGPYILNFSFWYFTTLVVMAMLLGSVMRGLRKREQEALRTRMRLEVANRETRRVSEDRIRLMHTMGHELRSPIAAVSSMLSALRLTAGPDLPEAVRKIHDRIHTRLKDLAGLIQELLELAEERKGERQEDIKRINLCQMLVELCEELQDRAKEADLKLKRVCDSEGDYWVSAPKSNLRRVFENLLTNAIKYSRPAGTVTIHSWRSGTELHVDIKDQGIGIAPDQIQRLFTEFYRTPQSRRHTAQGTGLGLAITRELIEAAGGRIEVESVLDQGSTFQVILPLTVEAKNE